MNGDFTSAYEKATKAIECDIKNSEAYNTRAVALLYLNDINNAYLDLNEAIKFSQQFFIGYCNRGRVLYLLEKLEDSLKDFNKCIELYPSSLQRYFNSQRYPTKRWP